MDNVINTLISGLMQLVIAVAGAAFTGVVLPWLVKTGLPWLKEKRIYSVVRKFVQAAEKQAEAGLINKGDKKEYVVKLLVAKGITVTDEVDAFIESAVKELDLAAQNALVQIGELFEAEDETTVEEDEAE